jgi:hypothetical protein
MIVKMPDGTNVDMGDHPSQDAINHVHDAAQAQLKSQSTTSTPTTSTTTTTTPTTGSGGGEADTATTTPEPEKKKGSGWTPTIARTAGPLIGGAVGLLGGPAGVMAGAAAGGAVGDIIAQRAELKAGERKVYNPLRTLAEVGSDTAFAGVPMGDAILPAVAKAGTMGVVSSNAISMSEGQGVNSLGQDAISFLTTGALVGGIHGTATYMAGRNAAVKEIAGVPQIEEHMDILTKPDAPTHGPDGVPTEIPAPTLVDEFGKPITRQGKYPPPADIPGPAGTASETPFAQPGDVKVGQTPVRRDTGLSMSSAKSQRKQAVIDTWMEQRRPGIFEAEPIKGDIPPLEKVTEPILENDGGMEGLQQQADEPVHDIPGNGEFGDPSKMTQRVMQYMGRTKTYFQRLEDETGYPVYQDYDKLSQANKAYQVANKQMSKIAGKALQGTDRGDWTAMMQDMAAGADGGTLQPKLRAKLDSLTKVTDRALEPFDMTAHDLFTEYVPAMLTNDQDTLAQDKFGKFQDAMIQGKVNLQTTDLPRMMQQITNMGAFEDKAADTVSFLKNKYSANLDAPESVKRAINYYTGVLDGTPDRVSKAVGGAITDMAAKFGWTVDGDGIAQRMVSTQYAAALAGRPGPVIRRLLHPMQTAVGPMGFSWLAEGYRQMATSAGRSLVESSGIAADTIMNELATSGKTLPGRFTDKVVGTFMAPFASADLLSRGPVYLGQRAKILWAAEKYGDDMSKFLTKSGVGRYSKQEANIILDLLSRGDAEGAANRGAEMMNDNTQFMYSQLERPRVLTGSGRSLGGFGVWPMQYGGYLARMFDRGANGTSYEVARDLSRWLAGNAAIVGGFAGAAKFINDEARLTDTFGWSFVSHVAYTGSPLLSSIYAGAKDIKSTMEGRPPTASEVWRDVAAPNIPLAGLGMDIARAREEPTTGRSLAYFTGLYRPKKSTGGLRGLQAVKGLKGL